MEQKRNKRYAAIVLGVLILVGAGLHFYRISWPADPVFDEAHFATYAGDYFSGHPFLDIHPALGKLIYAAAIEAVHPTPLDNAQFVKVVLSPSGNVSFASNIPFGSYPYIPLRILSALFGLALAVVFYWFLRTIEVDQIPALLAAFFIIFDNALLVETRLILLNGMYLVFGFIALALYFKRPRWTIASGIMLGLCLGVKLIGIVFVGPIIIDYLFLNHPKQERKKEQHTLLKIFGIAFLVLFLITLLTFVFFSPAQIISAGKGIGIGEPIVHSKFASFLAAYGTTLGLTIVGYLQGGPQLYASPWYMWPAMQMPMVYYSTVINGVVKEILLEGNPIVWFASTLAIIIGLAMIPRFIKRKRSRTDLDHVEKRDWRIFWILLGGYIVALAPFFTFVERATFLYHYFPALLFAIGFLAWGTGRWFGFTNISSLSKRQVFMLALIVLIVVAGFLRVAPVTYGL